MTKTTRIGPAYLLLGMRLLHHRQLRWLVLWPLLINAFLFIGLTWLAVDQFGQLLGWLTSMIPTWLDFIRWIFWVLFGGFLLLVYGYTFAILGNLLASPFYGPLSERTEQVLTNNIQETPISARHLLALAGSAMKRELIKLGYFLPRILGVLALTLALSFIPVLNLVGPAIAFLWGGWSLALQYLDYPADNHRQSFAELRGALKKQRLQSLSFGGTVLIATTVPLLNLFVMPASVVGATCFWFDHLAEDRPSLKRSNNHRPQT
ncbi:sulfate transporter CysZ [Porticoccus sp.]|uniref:sulfate transporter CysZ n=1 Tax=Porticoccus sp. TaxID=2024853 RepID=UPI003F698824